MASHDILILSSSPPKPFRTYNMSSSPLPSLSELTQRKAPALRTGSRAAPIPQNASMSFTSAASLLKAASAKDLLGVDAIQSFKMDTGDDGDPIEELPKLPKPKSRKPPTKKVEDAEKAAKAPRKTVKKDTEDGEAKKSRKPRAKATDQDTGDNQIPKEPAPRKPRAKKAEKDSNPDEALKEKPARKLRAKKADGESQTTLAKGQVTKSSSKSSDKVDKTVKSKKLKPGMTETQDSVVDSVDLGLDDAVQRRTDWTPPTANGKTIDLNSVSGDNLDAGSASTESIQAGDRSKTFTDLFGNFGFSKLDNNELGKKSLEQEKPRKRKLIELVKTSVSSAAAASPKEKAPKKKAKTITAQATSAYAEEEISAAKPAPLLQYFSRQTTERVTSDGFKVPPKPRSKSPVKGVLKAKKGSAEAPILLSPESALKQSGNQDFVFGTSSQLAREDSPTLLRDLHEAMQASNEFDEDDPFTDLVYDPLVNRRKALVSAKRNLWSAAARDTAGDLLEVEMVDLVDSPVVTREELLLNASKIAEPVPDEMEEGTWHDIEESSEKPTQLKETTNKSTKAIGPLEAAIRAELLSSPPDRSKSPGSTPRKSKTKAMADSPSQRAKSPAKASRKRTKTTESEMPDFSAYTTAQLAKEVASYRFKPVKSRDGMIALLKKCWEGKNRIALGAMGTNILSQPPIESSKVAPPSSQISTASPKRPRGRPRKDSTASTPPKGTVGRPKKSTTVEFLEMDSDTPPSQIRTSKKSKKGKEVVEDISDSDAELRPSPPRRQASQNKTPPLPLKLSTDLDLDSPVLSPSSSQALLFTHITRAVKSAPLSKDPQKPSWHEKILLYDPIILEDLTVWLNTGALGKAGWDGEVEPKEVKKWCEGRSICCLWKENLRGGSRSRY